MFNRLLSACTLAAAATMASAHLFVPLSLVVGAKPSTPVIPGQIMVKITPGKETSVATAYGKLGMTLVSSIPQIGWQLLKLPQGMSVDSATTKLKAIPGVSKAAPDRVTYAAATVNDPLQNSQYSLTKMQMPAAWDINTGSASTIVAVLDTGTDYTHPDLVGKIIKGRDFIQNDDDPMDVQGHGTHVSGSVAANTNNGVGVAGIGYNTKVLAVRVLGDNGSGSFSGMAQGIIWAADHGANIINMSIQAPGVSSDGPCDDAIAYANDKKNVLLIVCAGNYGDQGNPRSYPGYNAKVIAVGASDRNDQRAGFSMYNPIDGSDNWVDVAAPGVDVLSTVMGPGYANYSGTSMATPNTAGVASLVWSALAAGGDTPKNSDVRKIIEESCDPIGKWINFGRVNAYEALLRTGTPVTDSPTPADPAPRDGTFAGTGSSLLSKDGISGVINSVNRTGVGLVGSFTTSFTMSQITTSELTSGKMNLTMSGDAYATFQIFMYDSAKGDWVLFKAQPMSASTKTTTISLPKATLTKYMQGDTLPVLFRTLVPVNYASRAKGSTKIDQASVSFTGFRVGNRTNP